MEQTTLFAAGKMSGSIPWYVMLTIIFLPLAVAICLTMASSIVYKRINRAAKCPPLPVMKNVGFVLLVGAIYGPLCQWGLQDTTSFLTGVPVQWKIVVISPFITGVLTMIFYDVLRWQCKRREWVRLYELISVKHRSDAGDTGDTPPSDLTEFR